MVANRASDNILLKEAMRLSGHVNKQATINEALHEYVRRQKQGGVIRLFGKIDVDPDYDYKQQRRFARD
ncbi:MAG: type II toxin-antitoxin system VapB family antitoxin [Gemmatimonas sp.]